MPHTSTRQSMLRKSRYTLSVLACLVLGACGGGGGGGGSAASGSGSDPAPAPVSGQANQPSQVVTPPPEVAQTNIKALVYLAQSVEQQFADPSLRVDHLINVTNDIFSNSELSVKLSLAHLVTVDYPDGHTAEAALEHLTLANHPVFDSVHQLRDDHSADVVLLVRPYANDGYCGYAWLGGSETSGDLSAYSDYAYAVVSSNCTDYVLSHELGHLLGLSHSRRENDPEGTHPYARGFGMDNDFATIMASPAEFNATPLPIFSSPALNCNGQPCGIEHTDADGADAVRTLRVTAPQVQDYRSD
ncbi:MAG: reprolysin-like metallopeptidase [Pseudomonadota bacterium]